MSYPAGIDVFTTKVDGVDSYLAAHMNAVQSAIVAVETELGTGLKGTLASLAARLAVGLNNDGTLKTAGISSLPANTVDTASIQALAVTAAKIAANTITAAQIAANTITNAQIANGTIGSLQIASNAITAAQIANNTITATQIAAGAVGSAQLDSNQIVRRQLAFLGTIPTTGSVECAILVPANGTITGLKLISKDSLLGSDSNFVTVTLTDMGANGLGSTALTVGGATDTTKVTGGTNGVVAYASTNFGVNGGAVSGNEVLKFVATVSGTLPNTLTNCQVSVTILLT